MLTPRIDSGAPRHRGARRFAVAHPRARRRLRQRPDDAAAAAARTDRPHARRSTSTSSAPRRRPSASCARSPRRRRSRSADASAPSAGARAAFDATLAFFAARARPRQRAGDVPPRRVPRAADVRELPRPAPRAARLRRRPAAERQPLRPDQPLRRAHAAPAARSVGALRSHPHAGAHRRGHARHPRPALAAAGDRDDAHDAEYLARTVQALADGRPVYVRALADELAVDARARRRRAAATPISALAALLAPDGRLAEAVRLLLRAAPAPRARLRRAQGDSRDPRRRKKG